jgi:hypothetical protein
MARDVPKVKDFNGLELGKDSIVNMKRRMKDTTHSRKAFDGFAEARKTPEKIYVVQERGHELLGGRSMLLPRPRENAL